MPLMSDPRQSFFTTHGVADMPDNIPNTLRRMAPDAMVIQVASHNFLDELLASIKKQVQDHGTQKTLVINAHGAPLLLTAEKTVTDVSQQLYLPDLLDGIKKLQTELGQKVAERLVLDSCDVLTNMTPGDVRYMRSTAQALGTEIVGATEAIYGGDIQQGHMVHFGADGSVSRDYLDTPVDLMPGLGWGGHALAHFEGLDAPSDARFSDSWFACHIGQSQDAGAACQANQKLKNLRDADQAFIPTEAGGTWVSNIPDKLRLSTLGTSAWLGITIQIAAQMPQAVDPSTLKKEQAALFNSDANANPYFDKAAVDTHEKFILGLSPDAKAAVEQYAAVYMQEKSILTHSPDAKAAVEQHAGDYEQAHSSFPSARPESRDTAKLKTGLGPTDADTSTGQAAVAAKPGWTAAQAAAP
jgi:hypothetical protein